MRKIEEELIDIITLYPSLDQMVVARIMTEEVMKSTVFYDVVD